MKKVIALLLAAIGLAVPAVAQVYVDMDMLRRSGNTTMEMQLQDSKSHEPIAYATVYLVPQGDTTITHFAISDAAGKVKIEEIISGKYQVNAEMIGYKPYVKVHDLAGWRNDLGLIDLEEDAEYIDAATITAIGNAVTVVKDTIVFNASAFHVGENAMLEDLLKKMPGMEVSSDGTVKVNGEAVDKITVGGKTFFFNDPAMALKNLPAKIVDKIKVVDKDKEEAQFSGIGTRSDKEKVMDVQLKEEYKKGWFGNAKIYGGSTLGDDGGNELLDDIGGLFNANGMAARYNETDQFTLLGNGSNAPLPGASMVFVYDGSADDDELSMKMGQVTSAKAGANYNTERVKGFDMTSSVTYAYTDKDAREKTSRTSFQPDGSEFVTDSRYGGLGTDHKVSANFNVDKKEGGHFMLHFRPDVSFISRSRNTVNSSETASAAGTMNTSNSTKVSQSDIFGTSGYLSTGFKDIGKERRTLTYSMWYSIKNSNGTSSENSETVMGSAADIRHLLYDNEQHYWRAHGQLSYTEPFGERWALQARLSGSMERDNNTKNAFNGADGSANDYYSSFSSNRDLEFSQRLIAQYKTDKSRLSLGAMLNEDNNVTTARTIGIEHTTGVDDWIVDLAPYAEYSLTKDRANLTVFYQGNTETPSGTSLIPALDISNPVFVSTGNIYLKPSFDQYIGAHLNGSNPQKFLFYSVAFNATLMERGQASASWFDSDGIRYSIPVNSKKPGVGFYLYGTASFPLDKKRHFTLSMNPYVTFSRSVGYQARGTMPGFDKDNFDYAAMMSSFWGDDASGERFYSGQSGFSESMTTNRALTVNTTLKYTRDRFSADLSGNFSNNHSIYSLDSKADTDSWTFNFGGSVLYETKNGFEFGTDAAYSFYRGFTYGYGEPSLIWDAKISKNVKSFVFSIQCSDILNQNRALRRSASAEYVQDTYSNVFGRYIMLGVGFNFGKMNARNNSKAQGAMYNVMF